MSTPDDRRLSPDDGHAAIQIPLWDAIDRLECEVERIDDAFLLLLSTVDFASGTLRTVLAGQEAIAGLQAAGSSLAEQFAGTTGALVARLDDLAARVAVLEAASAPEPEPEPQPDEPEPANDAPPEDLTDPTEETP